MVLETTLLIEIFANDRADGPLYLYVHNLFRLTSRWTNAYSRFNNTLFHMIQTIFKHSL